MRKVVCWVPYVKAGWHCGVCAVDGWVCPCIVLRWHHCWTARVGFPGQQRNGAPSRPGCHQRLWAVGVNRYAVDRDDVGAAGHSLLAGGHDRCVTIWCAAAFGIAHGQTAGRAGRQPIGSWRERAVKAGDTPALDACTSRALLSSDRKLIGTTGSASRPLGEPAAAAGVCRTHWAAPKGALHGSAMGVDNNRCAHHDRSEGRSGARVRALSSGPLAHSRPP